MMGKPFHAATPSRHRVSRSVAAASLAGREIGAAGSTKRNGRKPAAVLPSSLISRKSPIRPDNAVTHAAVQSDKKDRRNSAPKRRGNPADSSVAARLTRKPPRLHSAPLRTSRFSRKFMADHPQKAHRPRPLSPFVTIYHWPVTMATSITHRFTGIGLAGGLIILTWWLIAIASGPDAFAEFMGLAATPLGQVILFLIIWSMAFHLLNGIRHLAWDMGFGFSKPTAKMTGWLVIVLSVLLAAGAFALAY